MERNERKSKGEEERKKKTVSDCGICSLDICEIQTLCQWLRMALTVVTFQLFKRNLAILICLCCILCPPAVCAVVAAIGVEYI